MPGGTFRAGMFFGIAMKLCKFQHASINGPAAGIVEAEQVVPLLETQLTQILESDDLVAAANAAVKGDALPLGDVSLLAPIDTQEVWAAGVTYKRSQTARMEESEAAASCYDRVYAADRPELFFKATPQRVVGPGSPIRIRQDATWNVPEPELTLVMSSKMKLVGFTVGNDMSSRDIEGENPLYLPQAKTYDQCCGLGPWITVASAMPAHDQIGITLRVIRDGNTVFDEATSTGQMARSFEDLMGYLGRDNTFPNGVFLLTGTGIVPDSSFTLAVKDEVQIEIDGVGTLSNIVVQG
jgi:2-dehydro-3-deoxy-D-arabinonate dehydratase